MRIKSKRISPNDQELREIDGVLLDVFLRFLVNLEGKEIVILGIVNSVMSWL
jgi:hypothetical protein